MLTIRRFTPEEDEVFSPSIPIYEAIFIKVNIYKRAQNECFKAALEHNSKYYVERQM